MALIHKSGEVLASLLLHLRPRGDRVSTTGGRASGPVSFMRIFDTATEVVKQVENAGELIWVFCALIILIFENLSMPKKTGFLENFNLSVAITDEEMEKCGKGKN